MFEDMTYEKIMDEMMEDAPEGIDTRQGSIYYDAVSGMCFKLAKYYADLSMCFDLVFLTTAIGKYLDMKGEEYGVYRNNAIPAFYHLIYEGTAPLAGSRFFTQGHYFILENHEGKLCLKAEEAGAAQNSIIGGTPAVPVENIPGLTASGFGELVKPGADTEEDESYRRRISEKLGGPADNGNKQHYKTWCEEKEGVGRAKIIPLWAGANTVKGVLVGTDGFPAKDTVVAEVQSYIDPITHNIQIQHNGKAVIVGDGLGNGTANIGAHFLAVAAERLEINLSFSPVLSTGTSPAQVKIEAEEALTQYLKTTALTVKEDEQAVISIGSVWALINSLPSVIYCEDLRLNGDVKSIEIPHTHVAVPAAEGVIINV